MAMKRASYRAAIAWIAENDSNGEDDRLDAEVVSSLITAILVADVFGVPTEKVGRDIVRHREDSDLWRRVRGEVLAGDRCPSCGTRTGTCRHGPVAPAPDPGVR